MDIQLTIIMFTDEVGSTANTERRVHKEIGSVRGERINLTAEAVGRCRGVMLKDCGDGHMIRFRSCSDAVLCGHLIQLHVEEHNRKSGEMLRFALHIGIDLGEVLVLDNGDLLGNAVNIAARVCAQAPGGEVYFTEKVKNELHPRVAEVEFVGSFRFKGVEEEVRVYRLKTWLGPVESPPSKKADKREPPVEGWPGPVESDLPNPFIWRDGITRAQDFFGRESELRRLRDLVRSRQNCQIVGPRRVGKTSLLRQIEIRAREWEAAAVVAYVDQQDARCHTRQGWLKYVSRKWRLDPVVSDLVEFSEQVDELLARNICPVLCLDEFEEMTARPAEFTRDFFLALRACGQKGLRIITASKKPLNELTDPQDSSSPFFNTFPVLLLGAFTGKEAEDFVSAPRGGVPPFTAEEKQKILVNAKQHPLALQIICYYVLEARDRESISAALSKAAVELRALLPQGW